MNWRSIAITGLVAGMVAVTGCSTNLPETNQGNRNGQRVADAVNRREDTYRTTSNRLAHTENNDYMGRHIKNKDANRSVTSTVRNAADKAVNTANRFATAPSRNLNLGRPEGRIGNAFRYGGETGRPGVVTNNNGGTVSRSAINHLAPTPTEYSTHMAENATVVNDSAPATHKNNVNATVKPIDTRRDDSKVKSKKEVKHETRHDSKDSKVIGEAPEIANTSNRTTSRAAVNNNVANSSLDGNRAMQSHMTPSTRTTTRNTKGATQRPTLNNSTTINNRHAVANTPAKEMTLDTNNRIEKQNHNKRINKTTRATRNSNKRVANKNSTRNQSIKNIGRVVTDETVPVVSTDDSFNIENEVALFRKKIDEQTQPATPAVPEVKPTPDAQSYDDSYYYDVDDSIENDTPSVEKPSNEAPSQTAPSVVPVPARPAQRVMK